MNNEERNERPLSTADMVAAAESKEKRTQPAPRVENTAAEESLLLLSEGEMEDLRSRWDSVQTHFVDEPRASVEQADSLVAEVMKKIAQMFTEERRMLEDQWNRGDDVSTEDLRIALQRYRSFFNRLLSL